MTQLSSAITRPAGLDEHLLMLLTELASGSADQQGYGPANLVTLLRLHRATGVAWIYPGSPCAVPIYKTAIIALAFTSDSRNLLNSGDSTLRLWDIASGRCICVLRGNVVALIDVDWSPGRNCDKEGYFP